jgi:hypothetical protein
MTFLFPVLLGGLVLAGIPVALHLIMRQRPKALVFPAFRFLVQKHRTNQRKLRLRHLILLALRFALIIAICLALSRPKVFSGRFSLGNDRPVAAVLLFDTSFSMGYVSGGKTRLDDAKQRAQELLAELPAESRIAVLDTAQGGGEWLPSTYQARDRVAELRLQPANLPVTTRLGDAYRLLADLSQDHESAGDDLPRFIYIFSDRTQECWDTQRLRDLQQLRDREGTPIQGVFVDVGIEKPVDVALAALELPGKALAPNDKVRIRATVRAVGDGCNTELTCRIDSEKSGDRKPIILTAGQSQVVTFERPPLPLGHHQVEVALASADALTCDNALYGTFEVSAPRQLLALVDEVPDADFWKAALSTKGFQCEAKRASEVAAWGPAELLKYRAICLMNVPAPSRDLWEKLARYVGEGRGLAIMPGGQGLSRKDYNDDEIARGLMPGELARLIAADKEPGATWRLSSYQHPVLRPLGAWNQTENYDFLKLPPAALRYWEVKPYQDVSQTIVSYADKEGNSALLERKFDSKKRGRVLLYTTPFDRGHLEYPPWNDYLSTSFYLVILYYTMDYLAGATDSDSLNFQSGQVPNVSLPPTPWSPTYTLQGPGLSATDAVVNRAEKQNELALAHAVQPGNYALLSPDGKPMASFSVNLPPGETLLTRAPAEPIEALLGKESLLPVQHGKSLREAIGGHWNQPVDLFPWLMILVLLLLAAENLFANKFYRRKGPGEAAAPAVVSAPTPETLQQAG